ESWYDIEDQSTSDYGRRQQSVTTGGRHYCNLCGKLFPSNWKLQRHMRVHTGEKPFICSFCNKGFNKDIELNRILIVRVERSPSVSEGNKQSYPCNHCGRMFDRKYNLEVHTRIHTGERPFVCKVCGKAFNRKSILQAHMLTHMSSNIFFICFSEGNKQSYPCNHCGRMFDRKYNLEVHTRIHTGERPFVCKVCGKAFNRKSILQAHMLTHMSSNVLY
ncbi:gastrula zinc finger protein XlCGF7.1-like, partial [Ruditapes philippinarum]|uniref:gastrula zinc finger protein XlCGF7.1-like n=1 Tax=Ruditapes philippinarum TaxID=129788 RepID=UPI00295B27AE